MIGSEKVPSSLHNWSFSRLGRPAKRSSIDPTIVFCSELRDMPEAVFMLVFSILGAPVLKSALAVEYSDVTNLMPWSNADAEERIE